MSGIWYSINCHWLRNRRKKVFKTFQNYKNSNFESQGFVPSGKKNYSKQLHGNGCNKHVPLVQDTHKKTDGCGAAATLTWHLTVDGHAIGVFFFFCGSLTSCTFDPLLVQFFQVKNIELTMVIMCDNIILSNT